MNQTQVETIKKCQKSVTWFLRNFGKLKHPSAGILSFYPFSYQRKALQAFRKHRLNIFRKCRQAGVSKISGAFALWFAMFFNHKTILIVSRTDDTAMEFLRDQILFLFDNLPPWMKDIWKPVKRNDHELHFPNGSKIKSLTSHPDVLRSNASSLNIIDEAAFIPSMDAMWAGGWPTLQHGGNVIVISTTNGLGGWYWGAVTDAEAGVNQFNPCTINWWDMDWVIEYVDPLSNEKRRIAPRDGLVACDGSIINNEKHGTIKLDKVKYGPYWSPWLEEQYRGLQERGEAWKFEQEVLASFVGSGNTVLPKEVLAHIEKTVVDPPYKVSGLQPYIHPSTGVVEELNFDFDEPDEGFWIWDKPVASVPTRRRGDQIVSYGTPAHTYVMGVDIATGKGRDFSAIEVFDISTRRQVAEFMARCLPREFVKFVDRIGRWYNSALAVVERNNGGDIVIDALRHDLMYPAIWRRRDINDKPRPGNRSRQRALKVSPYGFSTSASSKPMLNKLLIDFIRTDENEGFTILSYRLLRQFHTYVRKRDRSGRDTNKTEAEDGAGNYDDLVMACAMALLGTNDSVFGDSSNLMPESGNADFKIQTGPTILSSGAMVEFQEGHIASGDGGLLLPMPMAPSDYIETSVQRQIDAYTIQLGAVPISQGKPLVTPSKWFYDKK